MGTTTDAHCFACGYDVDTTIGGGMANFRTFSAWPVSCPRCEELVTVNAFEYPMKCPGCGSEEVEVLQEVAGGEDEDREWERLRESVHGKPQTIDDDGAELSKMWAALRAELDLSDSPKEEGRRPVEASGQWSLWRGRYLCSRCGEPQLRFGTGFNGSLPILWD